MRVIAALVALQILLLAFLAVRVVALDARVDALASVPPAHETTRPSPSSEQETVRTPAPAPLDEQRLRAIIREELANLEVTVVSPPAGAPPSTAPPSMDTDDEYQLELVRDELDFYINQGTISDAEMAALQREIAELHPQGREEMLRRLVQALNSGELDGRL